VSWQQRTAGLARRGGAATRAGTVRALRAAARRRIPLPAPDALPQGRVLDLPERGRTFVLDCPGPDPDAPVVVLLHALGCTAYLSWLSALGPLNEHYRVITFDQRWHGRGIRSARFRLADCADDVAAVLDALGLERAIVVGYSLGGAVAQLTWHRHPERVAGLVLCSIARNFRGTRRERLFFPLIAGVMHPLSGYALTRVERVAQTLPDFPSVDPDDPAAWGRTEFRSTSAWSMPEVLAELGRFNSADWIGRVDVPAAVVATTKDHTIPARRQLRLAAAIPGARVFEFAGGHASLVLRATTWVPVLEQALAEVAAAARPPQRVPAVPR
jgi:pimeloyl-ACP methyl ester carboxylesterase